MEQNLLEIMNLILEDIQKNPELYMDRVQFLLQKQTNSVSATKEEAENKEILSYSAQVVLIDAFDWVIVTWSLTVSPGLGPVKGKVLFSNQSGAATCLSWSTSPTIRSPIRSADMKTILLPTIIFRI